jgi:dihydrofolate synthase/folylpolyglutamate synthase
VLHVAGTNGKGSVATLADSALRAAGWRTGLYTSPHLVSFRERIRVNGDPISEAAVAMWTERLRPLMLERDATFFEATTAMAFADFAARGVEIAVVEVGLGGRLDSTNVVSPVATAVTRIAHDHERWLGDSLAAIAREKAGIAKPGVPFIIGEADPVIVETLVAVAVAAGARPVTVPPDAAWHGPLGLSGGHQRRNAAVAAALLAAVPEPWRPDSRAVAAGFADARLPGRMDRHGRWLFDVAHNADGIDALVAALRRDPPTRPVTALLGVLDDKNWPVMLERLGSVIDRAILTVPPTAGTRAWPVAAVAEWVRRSPDPSRWTVVEPFDRALRMAAEGPGTTLVTGSFHTVGDAMALLGLGPVGAPDQAIAAR